MKPKTNRFWNFGGTLALMLCIIFAGPAAPAVPQGKSRPAPAPQPPRQTVEPFLDPASGPITLAKVLDLLQSIQENFSTESRLLRAIEARGIDFPMTANNVQAIVAAGGSPKLIESLSRKAPPPPGQVPAPPKKADPDGVLSVRCQPGECEVSVGGHAQMFRSVSGTARITGLERGEISVEILKSGYVGQQRTMVIRSGTENSFSVALEPDIHTQAAFGARLFKAMVGAVGEETTRKEYAVLATGSATTFDKAGNGTEWNLTVTISPGQARLEARNSAGGLRLECRGETCQAQSVGKLLAKRLHPEEAQTLETSLRQFRKYQFAALLNHIVSAAMHATSKTADIPGADEQRLRLEGDGETYNISLDSHLLPSSITFESKTGLGSGLTVAFADYAVIGASHYPRKTEIKFPDGKRGLRVRFDQFGSESPAK